MQATAIVDVLGVVESVAPETSITRKDGSEARTRGFVIRDDSQRSIEVTRCNKLSGNAILFYFNTFICWFSHSTSPEPQVTLWGAFASDPGNQLEAEVANHPIVAIKAARVGEFNGKNLSTIGTSVVTMNPDIPDAGALRQWCVSVPSDYPAIINIDIFVVLISIVIRMIFSNIIIVIIINIA